MHCLAYLDDNIVLGSSIEEHIQRLDTVLERVASEGFMLNPSKCQWLNTSVKFLGHIVSDKGVTVDPAKAKSVEELPHHKTRQMFEASSCMALTLLLSNS